MRFVLALVPLALVSSAGADPDRKAFAAALARGRALENKHAWKQAVAAFDDALKIIKDDPTALGELGWAAYNAGDLPRAVDATWKAAHDAGAPAAQRGAAYYNLALIREGQHDVGNARIDYVESLRLRWNDTVFAALVKLDPVSALEFDPFHAVAMTGHFESVAAYCKTLPATEHIGGAKGDGGYDRDCTCAEVKPAVVKLAAPYTGVAVVKDQCTGTPPGTDNAVGHNTYALAVRTADGWFAQRLEEREFGRNCDANAQQLAFAAKVDDVIKGGQPELLVTTTSTGTCWHGDEDWNDVALVVVGSGKTLDATRIVTKRFDRSGGDDTGANWTKVDADVALEATWKPDGKLELRARTSLFDKSTAARLVGEHVIVFP